MKRILPLAVAGLVAATVPFGAIGAKAQTPAPAPSQPGPTPSSAGPGGPGGPSGGEPSSAPVEGTHLPVLVVTSVEVLRSQRAGGMDIVRARGLVPTQGWSDPHLLPITAGTSIDGTLDLIFQGVSPPGPEPLGSFMVVEAILPVEAGHPYKAVRVRSSTNAVTLKTLPGYQEIVAPKDDCAKCIGKYFVAKGATAPAGIPAADIVKEADMNWRVRVIGPNDGIPHYKYEPNRLTIVLTEDGRIADAAWD